MPRLRRPHAATMRSAGQILAWALLGTTVLLLVLGRRDTRGVAMPDGRPAPGAVADFERDLADKLGDPGPLRARPASLLRVTVRDVRWDEPGGDRRWLTVERVSASVSPTVLAGGDVVVQSLDVEAPVVRLRQDPNGAWNIDGLLVSENDGRPDNGGTRSGGAGVQVRDVRIRNGRVALHTPDRNLELTRLRASAPLVRLGGASPSPYVRLASLDAAVRGAIPGPAQALALRGATLSGRPDGIEFVVGRLALDRTVVADVEGVLSSALPDPGLRARGRAPNVDFADVHRLLPEFPESGIASFEWSVEPRGAGRLAIQLSGMDVRSEGSHVTGLATLVVGADRLELGRVDVRLDPLEIAFIEQFTGPLPYAGTLAGTVTGSGERLGFDVLANVRAEDVDEPIRARLQGAIALDGFTPNVERVRASVDALPLAALRGVLPGLPLAGVVSGTVTFAGTPGEGPIRIDADIDLPEGTIDVAGTVRLGGVPSYDLTGTLEDVRVRELIEPEFPPVLLNARFSLVGRGTDPATADARLSLSGRFTGWQAGPADLIAVEATLGGGRLDIDRGAVRLATLDARVTGDWLLVEPGTGGLRYEFSIASLEPFGPYLPGPADRGQGSFRASGTVTGTLDRLSITSDIEGDGVRYGEYAARSLRGTLEYAPGDSLPRIDFDADAEGVITPGFGDYATANAHLVLNAERFSAELVARRPSGGDLELRADGRVGGPRDSDISLSHALVDLGTERWTLARPAHIRIAGDAISVDSLVLARADRSGSIAVSGRLLPLSAAAFTYDVQALPVGEIQRLLGRDPVVTGRLWSRGRIDVADAPRFALDFRIEDAVASGVPILRLSGTTSYSPAGLHLVASGALTDTAGTIEADVTFPLVLSVQDSLAFGLNEGGVIDGRIRVDRFPLAVAAAATTAIEEPVGSISGTIMLSGSVEEPGLAGSLDLNGIAFTVPKLDRRFSDIGGRVRFDGRRAELEDVAVRAGGTATLSGSIVFQELDDPVLDVVALLEDFEPLGARDGDRAEVSGRLVLTGLLSAPTIGGAIAVDNGSIDVPTGQAADPFDQAELASLDQQLIGVQDLPGARPPAFGDVTIQGLVVDVGEDVWLNTPEARARLAGELTVFHNAAGTRVFGTLQGSRGTFTLRAGPIVRRFDIRQASIRFFGTPDLNPAIDITAARRMGSLDDPLELVVNVGGTLERPTVALSTGDGVPVPESELLSVLVLGRPSFSTATQTTESAVGALLALGGITDIASAELQEALAEDAGLPIDYVQLRATDEGAATADLFQNLTIALGTELYWDDVFLTVEIPPARAEDIAWAVQWRIDREWALEVNYEPILRRQAFDNIGLEEIIGNDRKSRQFGAEIRRRWTY